MDGGQGSELGFNIWNILRQPVFVRFRTFAFSFLRFASSFSLSSLLLFSEILDGDLSSSTTTSAESILVDASALRERSGVATRLLIHEYVDDYRLHCLVVVVVVCSSAAR